MSNQDSRPIKVTGEERAHPAVRLLARACIALAREQLAQEEGAEPDKHVKNKVETGLTKAKPTKARQTNSQPLDRQGAAHDE